MDFLSEISVGQAFQRIHPYIYRTDLEYSPLLSQKIEGEVYLKLENQQRSGSFKYRGAINKLLSIKEAERSQAYYIAASTGNHAAGFAQALKDLHLKGLVLMPENVDKGKLSYVRSLGVDTKIMGKNSLEAEITAREMANQYGYVMVHPYNDIEIIAGQGTVSVEISDQVEDVDSMIIPIGGGGLFSGIAIHQAATGKKTQLIGVQPVNSPEMYESIRQGSIITEDISSETLSDGTAGGMEQDAITFDICKAYCQQIYLIEEEEIASAIKWYLEHHQLLVEGSAALSLAGLLKYREHFYRKRIVLIISGKRISLKKLNKILRSNRNS